MSDFYESASHVLPVTYSDARQHILDDKCWCHPIIDVDKWEIIHKKEEKEVK